MNTSQRVHGLDLLRFLAISFVVLLHSVEAGSDIHPVLLRFFKSGWIGVDLFFVLSGYLIASQVFKYSQENKFLELKIFWIKRWWRTLPLYYFVLLLYIIVKPILGFPFMDSVWPFFFFLQNFSPITDFPQSWSLCIEEHFYLVFPVLAIYLGLKKRSPFIWLSFLVLSVCYRYYMYSNGLISNKIIEFDANIRFLTYAHLDGLSMGVFLAGTASIWKKVSRPIRLVLAAIGFGSVLYFSYHCTYIQLDSSVVWLYSVLAIGFSLTLIGTHDITLPNFLLKPIQYIALWSYGIYVYNGLLMRLFHHLNLEVNGYLYILIFYAVSVAVAIPTYYLIEIPFLKIRDRIVERLLNN